MARARLLRGLLCAAAAQGAFGLPPRAQRGVDPVFRAVTEAAAAVRGATAAPRLGGGPTAAADAGARRPSVPTCFVAPLYVEHPSGATPGSFAYSLPLKATRTESIQASPPLASKLNMSSNTTNFLLGAEQLQVTGGLDPVCRKWSSHESFQDLFSWAADPLRSSFGGFETVGGRRCALWRLRRLAGANLSLCADGDTPVQLTTSYYGGAYKYTMTFGSLSAVGPEVDPRLFQAPPACRALAPACAGARGAGPVAIDAYVFHPGMSAIDYDIADQDVADLAGDVDFICSDVLNPDRNGSFVDHNYTRISRYSLLVSPAFGQYALCNGYPDTDPAGPLCFGGDSRLVGREAPFFFGEGESRCAAGSRIGFWYSLPRAGRCDPGEKPSQDAWRSGCTWASLRRLKTIDQDCLLKQQKLPERCMADIREGLGLHRSSGTLELAFASDDLVKGGCPDIGGPPGEAINSAVQQAGTQVAQQAARETFQREQATCCANAFEYKRLLWASWPLPSCGMLRLRQESWEKHFEAWDVLWCQLQILTLPVYLLLYLWHSWPWNPIHLVGRLWKCALYTTIVVVQAFMAWYCIVSRGGCCGGVGYFLWCISLVISGACAFAGPGEDTEGYGYFAYLAQLIPVLYMCYACWQLKRATGFSVRQCCNAMTVDNRQGGQQAGARPAASPLAPEPSA